MIARADTCIVRGMDLAVISRLRSLPRVGSVSTFALPGRAPAAYRVCRIVAPYPELPEGGVHLSRPGGQDEGAWTRLSIEDAVAAHRPGVILPEHWSEIVRAYRSLPVFPEADAQSAKIAGVGSVTQRTSETVTYLSWEDVPDGAVVISGHGDVAQSYLGERRWLRDDGRWFSSPYRTAFTEKAPFSFVGHAPHDAPVEQIRAMVEAFEGRSAPECIEVAQPPAEGVNAVRADRTKPNVTVGTRVRWSADGDEGEVTEIDDADDRLPWRVQWRTGLDWQGPHFVKSGELIILSDSTDVVDSDRPLQVGDRVRVARKTAPSWHEYTPELNDCIGATGHVTRIEDDGADVDEGGDGWFFPLDVLERVA